MRIHILSILALALLLLAGACNLQSKPGQHAGADTPIDDERADGGGY